MRGRIFKSPITGGRLDNISKAWRSVLASAELKDFRFKDLRHTFGSWLAIESVDILQIRDLMGHTDVKTTQVYAHLCPDRKEQSVQMFSHSHQRDGNGKCMQKVTGSGVITLNKHLPLVPTAPTLF